MHYILETRLFLLKKLKISLGIGLSDYIFTAFKKFSVIFLGLVSAVLLARYLGPELRAEYAVVVNAAAVVSVILGLGVTGSFQNYRRQFGLFSSAAYFSYSVISFSVLSVMLAGLWFYIDPFHALIIVASISQLMRMQLQCYALVEDVKGAAVASVLGGIAEVVFVLFLWFAVPGSVWLGVCAILLKNTVISIVSSYCVWRSCSQVMGGGRKLFLKGIRILLDGGRFSLLKSSPYFLLTVLIMVNYKADILMLGYYGVDAAVLGVFSVGVLIAEYLWIFSDIFKDVQISRSSKGGGAVDAAFSNRFALFITIVSYIFYAIFGYWFVVFLFGGEFSDSYKFSLMILAANIFMVPCKILGAYLISSGAIKSYLIAMLGSVFLNIILNLSLIPDYGVYGAIFSSVVSYSLVGISVVCVFAGRTGVNPSSALVITLSDVKNAAFLLRARFFRKG